MMNPGRSIRERRRATGTARPAGPPLPVRARWHVAGRRGRQDAVCQRAPRRDLRETARRVERPPGPRQRRRGHGASRDPAHRADARRASRRRRRGGCGRAARWQPRVGAGLLASRARRGRRSRGLPPPLRGPHRPPSPSRRGPQASAAARTRPAPRAGRQLDLGPLRQLGLVVRRALPPPRPGATRVQPHLRRHRGADPPRRPRGPGEDHRRGDRREQLVRVRGPDAHLDRGGQVDPRARHHRPRRSRATHADPRHCPGHHRSPRRRRRRREGQQPSPAAPADG